MRPVARLALAAYLASQCACTTASPSPDATVAVRDGSVAAPADAPPDHTCTAAPYPAGPFEISPVGTLPDLHFTTGVTDVSLARFYAPCALASSLLVVRVFAAWSGPSRWFASHTARIRSRADAPRLAVLDLLSLSATNTPAAIRDLAPWRGLYDTAPDVLAVDPAYRFESLYTSSGRLPIVVLVDTRTMHVVSVMTQPAADDVDAEITRTLADLDGVPEPRTPRPTLVDNRFTVDQWDMLRAIATVPAPPPDRTNAHADDPAAAALGRALFSDARLSPSGTVSCATCHAPERAFTDGLPTAHGVATGDRNTPSVLLAAYQRWQFLDGRADSLWSQALGPCENPAEMNSSRLFVAHAIATGHASEYGAVFGALPPLADTARFPANGRPGDAAWAAMSTADQDAVTRVFVNAGKAMEAFERTLRVGAAPLDAYVAGAFDSLTPRTRDGLARWFEAGCIQCHYGPTLADDSFHDIRMPTGRVDGMPDRGRIDAIALLIASPFRADGPFSDDRSAQSNTHLDGLAASDAMLGQFHTTSLRTVARTAPWGHGGTFTTLESVALHYARIGMVDTPGTVGTQDLHLGNFHTDDTYVGSLVDAMGAMTVQPAP